MAQALNVGMTARSPLAGGVLTGKYHGHGTSEPGRMSVDMMKEFMPEPQTGQAIISAPRLLSWHATSGKKPS